MRHPYAAQARFSAPARDTPEPWRTCAGLLLGVVLYMALAQGFIALVLSVVPTAQQPVTALHGVTRLASVGLMAGAVALVVKTLHRRPARSLFGEARAALTQFRRAILPLAFLVAVTGAVQLLTLPDAPLPVRPLGGWLLILPVALAATLIQSASEEVVFRGYLGQQLAARFAHPLIWLALPSVLFGAVHYAPSVYEGNAAAIALWATLFGLAMADLTARSGTLGPAIAVHVAMNAWSILGLALPGPLVGLALYVLPFGPGDEAALRALLPAETLHIALAWLTARISLRV